MDGPLALARAVYVASLAAGFTIAALGLIRVRRRTGRAPLTLVTRPDAAELVRVGAVLVHAALYVYGTTRPDLWPFRPLWTMGPLTIGAGAALLFSGIAFYAVCVATLGDSFRIGGDPGEGSALVTSGVYARIRHPIYTAMMVEGLGAAIMYPCALTLAALPIAAAGMHAQARREERWWLAHAEEEYADYARRTGRFVPRLGR